MPYLDKEQKFYDYRTKPFDGVNPFDETKTGISFYTQLLTDPDYMEQYKNLRGDIVYMSPREYFNECAKIFESSYQVQVSQTRADKGTIRHLQEVLEIYKVRFPITFLNYAENTQEGRHRMFVVGELLGWDKKFPVLIVNWADAEQHSREERRKLEAQRQNALDILDMCIHRANQDTNDTVDEYIDDLKYYLKWKGCDATVTYNENTLEIEIKINGQFEFTKSVTELNILELFDYDDI